VQFTTPAPTTGGVQLPKYLLTTTCAQELNHVRKKKEAKETKWTEEKNRNLLTKWSKKLSHTVFKGRRWSECDDLIDIGIFYRFQ
jgi:hypothetical protein